MGMERVAPGYAANKIPRLLRHPSWEAALRKAVRTIPAHRLTAIVGAPGVGKSLLLTMVAEALKASGDAVTLVRHVGLRGWTDTDTLLLDEADKLSSDNLRLICAREKPVVLAGLPELLETLRSLSLQPATVEIDPLQPQEIPGFVHGLLNRDGAATREIDDTAMARLAERSAGVPRDTIILADLASFAAEQEGASCILARHVEQALGLRYAESDDLPALPGPLDPQPATSPSPAPTPRRRRLLWLPLMLVAAAGIWGGVVWRSTEPPTAMLASAPVPPTPVAPASVAPPAAEIDVPPPGPVVPPAPSAPALSNTDAPPPEPPAQQAPLAPAAPPPIETAKEPPPPAVPPVPQPDPLSALPRYASPRVVVDFPERDAESGKAAQTFTAQLVARGLAVAPPQPSADKLIPGIAYFYAQDAAGATALGQTLDLPVRQAPAPSSPVVPGTIEIALPPVHH